MTSVDGFNAICIQIWSHFNGKHSSYWQCKSLCLMNVMNESHRTLSIELVYEPKSMELTTHHRFATASPALPPKLQQSVLLCNGPNVRGGMNSHRHLAFL